MIEECVNEWLYKETHLTKSTPPKFENMIPTALKRRESEQDYEDTSSVKCSQLSSRCHSGLLSAHEPQYAHKM